MEISEEEFHKALIKYFKAYKKSADRWDAPYLQSILNGFERLLAIEQSRNSNERDSFVVRFGKNFGIYGFKIETIKIKK